MSTDKAQDIEKTEGCKIPLQRHVMQDLSFLNDSFTEIICFQLYSFEQMNKHSAVTFLDVPKIKEESFNHYQNNFIFRRKVQSTVSLLINATKEGSDNRMPYIPSEWHRIVDV